MFARGLFTEVIATMSRISDDSFFKVPEGHHPSATTLREALRGNLPLRGLCGGLSEGSAEALRGSAGSLRVFPSFFGGSDPMLETLVNCWIFLGSAMAMAIAKIERFWCSQLCTGTVLLAVVARNLVIPRGRDRSLHPPPSVPPQYTQPYTPDNKCSLVIHLLFLGRCACISELD